MTVEDELQRAMADEASMVARPRDRWAEIEARAGATRRAEARRRSHRKTGGLALAGLAAVAAAVVAVIALPSLRDDRGRRVIVTPVTQPTVTQPTVTQPTVTQPTTGVTTRPTPSTPVGSPTTAPATTAPPTVAGSGYQPLYPFRSLQEANAWRASNQATGAQPWHLDAGQTALSFTGFLGYSDVTTVFGITYDSTGAHVTVGFPNPNGDPVDAAVLHLRRFGTGGNAAPWEVVGTDDTPNFSLRTPRYGATVKSPLSVGGAITGVDENIRVEVMQVSSATPLGVFCCQPAGSSGLPWGATVSYGATDKVLIVAASTGGHLAAVERFTVTGVRTSSGTTPGL